MATVRLTTLESKYGGLKLPPVCMVCGEASTVVQTKSMAWHPPWVFLFNLLTPLVYLMVANGFQKQVRLEAPLCAKHKYHWYARILILNWSFVGIGFLMCSGFMEIGTKVNFQQNPNYVVWFGLALIILLIFWIILRVVLSSKTIGPQEITDQYINLTGVSPRFIDALNQLSEEDEDSEEEEDRPRRHRRHSGPSDAIQE